MEAVLASSIVQFAFLALKLDTALYWSWLFVFVPSLVILTLLAAAACYSLIIAIFLSRSLFLTQHRQAQIYNSSCHLAITFPLLAFFVLLSAKLDESPWLYEHVSQVSFALISVPLCLALALLALLSFGDHQSNQWWFALRGDLCKFILDSFPSMRQYTNVSVRIGTVDEPIARPSRSGVSLDPLVNAPPRTISALRVPPMWSIESPD